MKNKIGFVLNWLEMIFVLTIIFFAGFIFSSDIENSYIYSSLLILSAGFTLLKKRIRMPNKQTDTIQ